MPGTYTVTLRVVDKWGRASAPVTTSVSTAAEPAGNSRARRGLQPAHLHRPDLLR